jgi:hypothetical protein
LFLSQPSLLFHLAMGKDKKGQGSPRRSDDKRKRELSPSSEDFGDSEYSEEEFSSESEGSPVYAPPPRPTSSDDLDDSQGIAAEVWTYIRSVERAGLEGSDESEVSLDVENSSDSSKEGSGGDDEGDNGDVGDGSDDGHDDDKGGGGDDSGKGGDDGKGSSSKASGKAPLA